MSPFPKRQLKHTWGAGMPAHERMHACMRLCMLDMFVKLCYRHRHLPKQLWPLCSC